MKKGNLLLILILLISCLSNNLYSTPLSKTEPKGNELSNTVYSFLDTQNLNPKKQNLIKNGENNFPFNVLITKNGTKQSSQNLIFTFLQEDFINNKKVITDFIKYVNNKDYNFNIIFLFSYGERQNIKKSQMIYGVDSFIKTINSNDDYTSIIVDLSSDKNAVITNSNGETAPSWLIQNEYNTYIKNNIDENIPFFYLSQLYNSNFFYNRLLSSFFDSNIPAIRLNLNKDVIYDELIFNVLTNSIDSYNSETNRVWDQHFFMLRIFNNFKKFTEQRTIQSIILIVFVWILFILVLIFINAKLKKQTWVTIKHIWYSVPVTLILVFAGFLAGKYCFLAFLKTDSSIKNTFSLIELQLIFSLILVSAYYLITLLFNYSFYEKSIDYLIVISCFINQAFFIVIDISLFPIFMLICLLSILSLVIKNNGAHIAIFIMMLGVFVPYVVTILDYANFDSLYNYLITNKYIIFFISLVIYPAFLIYFRIITSFRKSKKLNLSLIVISLIILLSLIAIIVGKIGTKSLTKKQKNDSEISIFSTDENLIDCKYDDKYIFGDLIRTLYISFDEQPEQCNIYVTSFSKNPILYTENGYDELTPTTVLFNTTNYPPKNLSFKYGAEEEPSLITIFAIFPTKNEYEYKSIKKVVPIGR